MTPRPFRTWPDRVSLLLLLVSAALLLSPSGVRRSVAGPLQTALLGPLRLTARLRESIIDLRQQNRRLEELAVGLAVENARLTSTCADTSRRTGRLDAVAARIISRDLATFNSYLVINCGQSDGVRTGTPVIAPAGIVGVVSDAGMYQSLVQSLFHPATRVAVIDTRSRVAGLARSGRAGLLELDYVPKDADCLVGDTFVTAGLGEVFPKGLLVGTVEAVGTDPAPLFRQVRLRPFVGIERLERVFVLALPESTTAAGDLWLENLTRPERTPPGDLDTE